MAEAARDQGLLKEEAAGFVGAQQVGAHEFQGHVLVHKGVMGLVDHAHPPVADAL